MSAEQVLYTYDALNRLASAQTAGTGGWGLSYNYDGFGNLTDQNYIKGSVPTMHVAYNASNNRQTGDTADANGNIGSGYVYDIDNRLVQPGASSTAAYGYDVANKRVWRGDTSSGLDEIAFWAGKKLATYQFSSDSSGVYFVLTSTNVYFGGKLVSKGSYINTGYDKVALAPVAADRQGSIKKFYPFGVERPSATTNDTEKYTGYFRDASTGLDYADQRYEQPGSGRFMTPDSAPSVKLTDPVSWNKYSYVGGDPINRADPTGQYWTEWGWFDEFPYVDNYYLEVEADAYSAALSVMSDDYSYKVSVLQEWLSIGLIGAYTVDFWSGSSMSDNFLPRDSARGDLGKKPCYTLLGFSSAAEAQGWFDNHITFQNVSLGRLQLDQGTPGWPAGPPAPAPAQTSGHGAIYINIDYNWADFSKVITSTGNTYDYLAYNNQALGTKMNSAQLGTLIILHELQHNRPGGLDKESAAEKLALYNDCVK